jgi:hypothetical protein
LKVIPAICGGTPNITMNAILSAETPHDEKLPKYAEKSQMRKNMMISSSGGILLFYSKYILCPVVLCPILIIMREHARESSLIELMIAERLYDREELSTSRVYKFSIIDDALELSEVSISSILIETEDSIAIEIISLARA